MRHRHAPEPEVRWNKIRIHLKPDSRKGLDGLDFGSKEEQTIGLTEIQRLFPNSISGEHKVLGMIVINRKREHAFEFADGGLHAFLGDQSQQRLGVRAALKDVALFSEFFSYFKMIVNFAVERNHEVPD